MITALRPVVALLITVLGLLAQSASGEEFLTPSQFCAELPVEARVDCIAAGELLTAPSSASAAETHPTVYLKADAGGLAIEYRLPGVHLSEDPSAHCIVRDTIVLPANKSLYIMLTSADGIFSFEVPGHLERVDLVPGRVNERLMKTPAEAGRADGVLETDTNGLKKALDVRFVISEEPLDSEALCGA